MKSRPQWAAFFISRQALKLEAIHVRIEKKGRGGKTVTVLEGFTRRPEEMMELARQIKSACGTGGTVKEGRVEIQGDFRAVIVVFLQKRGFLVKGT